MALVEYAFYIIPIIVYGILISTTLNKGFKLEYSNTLWPSSLMVLFLGIGWGGGGRYETFAQVLAFFYVLYLISTDFIKVYSTDNTGKDCDYTETTSKLNTNTFTTIHRYIIMFGLMLLSVLIFMKEKFKKFQDPDAPLVTFFTVAMFFILLGLQMLVNALLNVAADPSDSGIITSYDIYVKYFDRETPGVIGRIIGLIFVSLAFFLPIALKWTPDDHPRFSIILVLLFVFIFLPLFIRGFYTDPCFYKNIMGDVSTGGGSGDDEDSNERSISERAQKMNESPFSCVLEQFGGIRSIVILVMWCFAMKDVHTIAEEASSLLVGW